MNGTLIPHSSLFIPVQDVSGFPEQKIDISLTGIKQLKLVATGGGDGITCDHADWVNARLIGNH